MVPVRTLLHQDLVWWLIARCHDFMMGIITPRLGHKISTMQRGEQKKMNFANDIQISSGGNRSKPLE